MISLGLTRISELVAKLGDPVSKLRVFHVAGTNGKGSVCTYIESVLAKTGKKTGKFTSPHLVHPNDAICINKKPINSAEYWDLIKHTTSISKHYKINATEFEIQTAAAFLAFSQNKIDVGVVEVGLGGAEDATNILPPSSVLCSVLTHISQDHDRFLGSTIEEVATAKAGIIKQGRPVAADGTNSEAVIEIIKKRAQELDAPIQFTPANNSPEIRKRNMAVAALALSNVYNLEPQTIQDAMHSAVWLGRMQWINPALLLDGAHNVAGAAQLRKYLDRVVPNKNVRFVTAFSKPCKDILAQLIRKNDVLVATEFSSVESMPWIKPTPAAEIVAAASEFTNNCTRIPHITNLASLPPFDGLTVVCGSLYLVGEFLAHNPAAVAKV